MKDSKIVILDGVPGGGKTSIAEHFKNKGIYMVPELVEHSLSDKRNDFDYYIISDLIKVNIASFARFSGRNVVMDRGPMSTLAFTYAYDQVHGTKRYGQLLKIFRHQFSKNLDSNHTLNILFYLDLETSLKRKKRNLIEDKVDLWLYKPFLRVFFNYYKNINIHRNDFGDILGKIIVIDEGITIEQSIQKIQENFIL